jgi:hypothetical protein
MTTINRLNEKRCYHTPVISTIELDNEISLAMESNTNPDPEPGGGGWSANNMNSSHTDPYKNMM